MDNRVHHVCVFRHHGSDNYVLWYTNGEDGLLAEADARLLSFDCAEATRLYANKHGLDLFSDDVLKIDFDAIEVWCVDAKRDGVDCELLLNAWNMLLEVVNSVRTGEAEEFISLDASLIDL